MRKLLAIALILLSNSSIAALTKGADVQPDNLFPKLKLTTNVGDVIIELDRNKAEITVNNFLQYAVNGSYDGTLFHRVIPNFVIQGGGYDKDYQQLSTYPPIINESGNGLKNELGTIAMARELDAHSATRQFFFNMGDNVSLNPGRNWGYTVFGTVMEGEEVLEQIQAIPTHMEPKLLWPDVPVKTVELQTITILPENE